MPDEANPLGADECPTAVIGLLAVSIGKVMPVIGHDLMPPMDTGIIKANVKFSANETVDATEQHR